MSRIKDLYAEVEGIDDLKPVEPHKYGKDFAEAVRQADIKRMSEQVYAKTLHMENLRSWLSTPSFTHPPALLRAPTECTTPPYA